MNINFIKKLNVFQKDSYWFDLQLNTKFILIISDQINICNYMLQTLYQFIMCFVPKFG
jgi:hypothetical protein